MVLPGRYLWRWSLLLLVLLGSSQAQISPPQATVCPKQGCQPPTDTSPPPIDTSASPPPTESPPPVSEPTPGPCSDCTPIEPPPLANQAIAPPPVVSPLPSDPSPPPVESPPPASEPPPGLCTDCTPIEPPPPANQSDAPPPNGSPPLSAESSPPPAERPPPLAKSPPSPLESSPRPVESPPPSVESSPPPVESPPPLVESSPPPLESNFPPSGVGTGLSPPAVAFPPPGSANNSTVPPLSDAVPPPSGGNNLPPPSVIPSPPTILLSPPPPIPAVPSPPPAGLPPPLPENFPPALPTTAPPAVSLAPPGIPSPPPTSGLPVASPPPIVAGISPPQPTTASPTVPTPSSLPPTRFSPGPPPFVTVGPSLPPPTAANPISAPPTTAGPILPPPTTASPISPSPSTASPVSPSPSTASPTLSPTVTGSATRPPAPAGSPAATPGGPLLYPPGGNSTSAPNAEGLPLPGDTPTPTAPSPPLAPGMPLPGTPGPLAPLSASPPALTQLPPAASSSAPTLSPPTGLGTSTPVPVSASYEPVPTSSGESVKGVPDAGTPAPTVTVTTLRTQDTPAPTQSPAAVGVGKTVPLVTSTIENGQVTTTAVTMTGTLASTVPVSLASPVETAVPAATLLPKSASPSAVPASAPRTNLASPAVTVLPTSSPLTFPVATSQSVANLVPSSALTSTLIVLEDGQTIAPDPYSQLMRTSVQSMLMSSPQTATASQQYSTANPSEVGTLILEPAIAQFTKFPSQSIRFRATGSTAQQCTAAGCTSTCQLDDGPAIPCGSAEGQVALTGLTDGEHRLVTALTTAAGSNLVAQHSAFFTVDTVLPVVTIGLEVGSPRVSTQVLDGLSTSFLVWDQAAPCPGYLVTSEPSPSIGAASFRIDGGVLQKLRQDQQLTLQARRKLLQTGAQQGAGPVGYRFEVVPVGLGPSLLTVAVRSGGFQDRAGNDVNLTPDASATVYYDAFRPQPVVSRADAGRPGLSTDVNVTLLVDFGQPVTGFDPFSVSVTNGKLIGFLEDRTHSSAGQLYLLDFSIDRLQTLTAQVVENAAQDYAGHLSLASKAFEVLHYEPSAGLIAGLRAVGGATVGITALAAVTSGPWGIADGVTTMGLFAASTNLAAPLPPNYVTAADSLQFALWRWTCPFTSLNFVSETSDDSAPQNAANSSAGTTAVLDRGVISTQDSVPPKMRGRRLLHADSMVTRVLCGSRFADDMKRLERAHALSHWRALLQAASPAATNTSLATLPNNQTVLVTVVARAPGTNSTSRELPPSQYQLLLSQLKQLANFLQGNLPSSDNTGLREFFCVLFWITVLLFSLSLLHVLLYRFVRKKEQLPKIVVFPSIELTLLTAALIALVTACTVVIAQGSRLGIIVGSVVLVLPVAYLLWVAVHVHRHVIKHKSVAFVAKPLSADADASGGDAPPAKPRGRLSRWFEDTFGGDAHGEWEPVHRRRHRFFTARYGLFFDDLIGMPVERQGTTFSRHTHATLRRRSSSSSQARESRAGVMSRQDSSSSEGGESPLIESPPNEIGNAGVETRAPRVGLSSRVQEFRHEYGGYLRPYYITTQLSFSVLEAIVLASWAGSEHSWAQLSLVFLLKAILAAWLFILMPFKEARYQFAEVINVVCDLISALLSFVLLGLHRRDSGLGIALIVLQVMPIVAIGINGCVSLGSVTRRKAWPLAKRVLRKQQAKRQASKETQHRNSSESAQTVDVVVLADEIQ